MAQLDRPALGAETEIALALITLTESFTDSTGSLIGETDPTAICGAFVVIACTKNIELDPPSTGMRPIRNGLNPAAQLIPDVSKPGKLSFSAQDLARDNVAMNYDGRPCVARLKTKIDDTLVRTYYCAYYVPDIRTTAPEGDEVGTISGEGEFYLFKDATP
jgi:hypothetical protein